MRAAHTLLLLTASACVGANAGTQAANAAIATAVGLTAAGLSRASGGCWAACPTGTSCNRATGLCDELPCRGLCSPTEHCKMTAASWKCVVGEESTSVIQLGRQSGENPMLQPAEPSAPNRKPRDRPVLDKKDSSP